ncbi:MAG: hypothetical protein LBH78_01665 [Rickettsiales bacterium]|nr:hypothetical protein [Rickettsiales bacterium]
MNTSIRKWGNTVHITKMGIEGTAALASLAAAITTVLIATNIVAVPESLALISTVVNPIGIAALFIAAIYFTILAISSYQQMRKNEEMSEAKTSGGAGEVEAKIADLATKTELSTKADKTEVEAKITGLASKADLNTKADKTALEEVQESITSLTTNLGKKLNSSDLKEKVKTVLQNPEVTALLKEAISQEA